MDAWGALLGDFVRHQRAADRSPATIRLYQYRLLDLAAKHPDPAKISARDLEEGIGRAGLGPDARKTIRSAYRVFFGWAHDAGRLPDNPAARLPTVRIPRPQPRPIPEPLLLEALRGADDRGRLMLMLAAYAGLRAAEVARVHVDDFDRYSCTLRVYGKGRKVRDVPIEHAELGRRLAALQGWAFPGRTDGGHLSPGHVTKLVSRMLPDGWTAHPCRHRMATTAYAGTRDLLAVGELLGHSRPETTQRYVRLPDDALRAAARAAAA